VNKKCYLRISNLTRSSISVEPITTWTGRASCPYHQTTIW